MTELNGECISRLIFEMARDNSFDLYREAVRRGIIDGGQAEGLMALWLERHPYEPRGTDIDVPWPGVDGDDA